jgi:hypothetical protein
LAAPGAIRYRAFLSYSHRDAGWGKWLHSAVEHYRVDKDLVGRETPLGPVPKTLRPIFRDREEFSAGSSLAEQTVAALEASQCLIVICSPNAAASKYVNEEIRRFKMLGRSDRIIPVIIDGEPGDPMRECFPPALHLKLGANGQLSDDREELIAADARPHGDGKENVKLKVVAGLLGTGLDEIVRRAERGRRQRLRNWIGALAVLALTLASLAVWAEINRRDAEAERQVAQEQRQQAERNEARAKAERDQALITQSRFLADLSHQNSAAGDATTGMLLAIEALTSNPLEHPSAFDRPYSVEAERSLYEGYFSLRERLLIPLNARSLTDQAKSDLDFSEDGRHLILNRSQQPSRVWDLATGEEVTGQTAQDIAKAALERARKSSFELASNTGTLSDKRTGHIVRLRGIVANSTIRGTSLDGSRVLTGAYGNKFQLWNTRNGQLIGEIKSDVIKAALIFTQSDTIDAALSFDGRLVATREDLGGSGKTFRHGPSNDSKIKIWDSQTQASVEVRYRGGSLRAFSFTPDGDRLTTEADDGTLRLWDVRAGAKFTQFSGLSNGAISQGERLNDERELRSETGTSPAVLDEDGNRAALLPDSIELVETKTKAVVVRITVGPWAFEDIRIGREAEVVADRDETWIILRTDDGVPERGWRVFPTTRALVEHAKQIIPRCLTHDQRTSAFLNAEPPAWCIKMEKWPYHTPAWKQWLAGRMAGKPGEMPSASE